MPTKHNDHFNGYKYIMFLDSAYLVFQFYSLIGVQKDSQNPNPQPYFGDKFVLKFGYIFCDFRLA